MATKNLRVRPFYRVSTKGQLEDNDIPMQRHACLEFIKTKKDWVLDSKEYIEKGVSGYKVASKDRDVIQDVLKDAENKEFDILLVFMFDRIGRRKYETPILMKSLDTLGIQLWSVEEGQQKFEDDSDDLLNFIRFWQSSGESRKTSVRVSEDHKQMTLFGEYRGGGLPYGYNFEKSGVENKKGKELLKLVINKEEEKVIQNIFRLVYEKGYGGHRIAKYLNERGIPSSTGGRWRDSVINYMLKNPLYKGYYAYGRRTSDENGVTTNQPEEKWTLSKEQIPEITIIPEKLWDEVQAIRSSRSPKNVKRDDVETIQVTKSPLLFVGITRCGHCNAPLTTTYNTRPYIRADGTETRYRSIKYRCSGKATNRTNCDGQATYSHHRIENTVLEEVREYLSTFKGEDLTKEVDKLQNKSKNETEKEIGRLESNMMKFNTELEKLQEEVAKSLLGESHFKPEMLSNLIDRKQSDIDETKKKLHDLKESFVDERKKDNEIEKLQKYIPVWEEQFDKMNFEKKKMMLTRIIEGITVRRDSIDVKFNFHIGDFLELAFGSEVS